MSDPAPVIVPDATGCRLVTLDGRRIVEKPIIAWRVGVKAEPVTTGPLPAAWAIVEPTGAVIGHDGTTYTNLGRYIASKTRP